MGQWFMSPGLRAHFAEHNYRQLAHELGKHGQASEHRQVLVEEPLSRRGQGKYRGDRAEGSTGGKQDANHAHVLIELGEQEDWTDAQVVSNGESLEQIEKMDTFISPAVDTFIEVLGVVPSIYIYSI